jgi:hypothetical protein
MGRRMIHSALFSPHYNVAKGAIAFRDPEKLQGDGHFIQNLCHGQHPAECIRLLCMQAPHGGESTSRFNLKQPSRTLLEVMKARWSLTPEKTLPSKRSRISKATKFLHHAAVWTNAIERPFSVKDCPEQYTLRGCEFHIRMRLACASHAEGVSETTGRSDSHRYCGGWLSMSAWASSNLRQDSGSTMYDGPVEHSRNMSH